DRPFRIVLSPTHRRVERRWSLENYAKLADYLTKDWGAFVSWLWGPGEEQEIDKVMSLCKEKTYKAPPTTFRELAAFVANHDLFSGNSNGPSHVAIAVGIMSLQLHGFTQASAWSPLNEDHQAVENHNGINQITVAEICTKLQNMKMHIGQFSHK